MRKLYLMLVFLIFAGIQVIQAQTRDISGTVVSSEDGLGIPGVNIIVKGTTQGTVTDLDGKYKFSVPTDATYLQFKFVGMVTKEVEIGSQKVINVTMDPTAEELEGIVVTAMGISREKKSLGYSVQEVEGEALNRVKNDNVINSISGKVSGVTVKNNTNMGGGANILIRGSSSLTGDNQALFIVDGVPISNLNTNNDGQMDGRSGYDYGNPVSDINPNDIANVSVLKGAAATALYGSRAANGVILITTKKGSKSSSGAGKSFVVGYNNSFMFHVMDKTTFPVYQKNYGAGYGPYYSDSDYPGLYNYDFDGDGELDYVIPTTEDASMGSMYDPDLMVYQWDAFYPESPTYMQKSPYVFGANGTDYFFQTGHTFTNNVEINAASNTSTMRLSYTNTDQTGIFPNSSINKNNLLFNATHDLTDDIKITASANYTNNKAIGRNHTGYSDNIMSMFRQWYNLGVDMKMQEDYYNETGTNMTWNPHDENDLSPIYWDNPYWTRFENYQSDERDRIIGYGQVDWQLTECLSFMGRYSIDHFTTLQEERKAIGSVAGELGVGRPDVRSGYARNQINFTETNLDAMLKFNKYLNDDLSFNAFLGTNFRRTVLETTYASTNGGLAVPGTFALSNSANPMLPPEESYEPVGVNGYFGSASFGFKNMLYVDGTYRYDISSTLPIDNNGYGYYGASVGFVFSELIDFSAMDIGKVRFSYAQVGNDAPWGSVYDIYKVQAPFGGVTMARLDYDKNNLELLPELSGSLETGLELGFFENKLAFDVALYKTNTTNAVIPLPVSTVTGYSARLENIGEMENKGLELMMRVTPVRNSDFSWDIAINWAKNINTVVSLGDDIENLQLARLQGGVTINAREGEPYGVIQGTDYVYSPDGDKVVGAGGYYEKTGTSDQILGTVQPDWTGGINNAFSYKNLTASFLFDMQMGGSIFSLDQWYGMGTGLYAETDYTNDLGNPVRDPIVQNEDGTYADNSGGLILEGVVGVDNDGDGEYDEYIENTQRTPANNYKVFGWSRNPNAGFVYNATYVKLREAAISYRLPNSLFDRFFVSGASIGLIGSNLWILYKELPHADPEASQGAGNIQGWQSGVMPATKNFGFKLSVNF